MCQSKSSLYIEVLCRYIIYEYIIAGPKEPMMHKLQLENTINDCITVIDALMYSAVSHYSWWKAKLNYFP